MMLHASTVSGTVVRMSSTYRTQIVSPVNEQSFEPVHGNDREGTAQLAGLCLFSSLFVEAGGIDYT